MKFHSVTVLLGTLLLSLIYFNHSAVAQTAEEQRFNEIYKTYHSSPTDEGTWSQLTQPLTTETYKIQPGDNLWGISEVFFGDGNYWPKVWSVNSRIENPHLIEPGNAIKFRLGTAENEPSFLITEQNAQISDTEIVESESSNSQGVGSLPPPASWQPVLKDLPPSLPYWNNLMGTSEVDFDQWGVEVVPRPKLKLSEKSFLQSFVMQGPIDFAGAVEEALLDEELMVEGKIIYVRVREGQGASGQTFLIVHDAGPLEFEKRQRRATPGHVIRIAAQVTLKDQVEVNKPRRGFSYFKAHIDRSVDITVRGHQLIAGKLKSFDFSMPGKVSDLSVQVVGGQLDSRGFQFSTGNLVYLDQGTQHGVSEGDIFLIEKTKHKRFLEAEPLVKFTQYQAGQVQVVDVTEHYATAIVLGGSKSIRPGDGAF